VPTSARKSQSFSTQTYSDDDVGKLDLRRSSPMLSGCVTITAPTELHAKQEFLTTNRTNADADNGVTTRADLEQLPGQDNTSPPGATGRRLPHILSSAEQNAEYADFLKKIDTFDHEDDPHDSMITPEIFRLWAEGAVKVVHNDTKRFSEYVSDRALKIENNAWYKYLMAVLDSSEVTAAQGAPPKKS
jgi:hypothetical protein